MKQCRKCNTEKSEEDFRPKRRVCKECERAHGRAYRKSNTKAKEWTEQNKDRMKELQSNWYNENKEKINTKFKERYHDSSTDFKKIKNYRTAINHMIGGTQKTNKYIGCNRDDLIKWCEFSFSDGMTIDNYGTFWVVDHVIPMDKISEEPDLFNTITKWYNIMPVFADYNLKKNKYVDSEQIEKHRQKLLDYYEIRNLKPKKDYMELLARWLVAGNPLEP